MKQYQTVLVAGDTHKRLKVKKHNLVLGKSILIKIHQTDFKIGHLINDADFWGPVISCPSQSKIFYCSQKTKKKAFT